MDQNGTIDDILDLGASIITLVLVDDEGDTSFVPAEGRATIDALEQAFGDIRAALGQRIEYALTDFGTLAQFSVAGEG